MKSTPSKPELSQEESCFQTHYHLFTDTLKAHSNGLRQFTV